MDQAKLYNNLQQSETSFHKACSQIIVLSRKLKELRSRYDQATVNNQRAFRYSLRMRIAAVESVREVYCEYAYGKADLVTRLRSEVKELKANISSNQNPGGRSS